MLQFLPELTLDQIVVYLSVEGSGRLASTTVSLASYLKQSTAWNQLYLILFGLADDELLCQQRARERFKVAWTARFRPSAFRFVRRGSLQYGRSGHSVTLLENEAEHQKVLILCGAVEGYIMTNDYEVYSIDGGSWNLLSGGSLGLDLSAGFETRWLHSANLIGGHIHIFGGHGDQGLASGIWVSPHLPLDTAQSMTLMHCTCYSSRSRFRKITNLGSTRKWNRLCCKAEQGILRQHCLSGLF